MTNKAQLTKSSRNLLIRFTLLLIAIWTVIIGSLLFRDLKLLSQASENLAKREALAHFQKDEAFRFWSAKHGGFYVVTNERTPPSPYLDHIPERDIETPSGVKLTLMNPAYALRQMLEEYKESYGVSGHITSLLPLRPENTPDDWERIALESFENGVTEFHEFIDLDGEPHLRFIKPLITQKGCLKCHEHQGYKVGDIRGGVSVSVPLSAYLSSENKAATTHTISFALLWILGVIGIIISYIINNKNRKSRELSQKLLIESHDNLEQRVVERTNELQIEINNKKISEERYKGIIQSTASCIAVYKPTEDGMDFIFLDFNPMAEKIDNISKEEVIGKKVTEVFPGIEKFGLLKILQDVYKSGIPQHFPLAYYKDDKIQGYRENHVYKLSTGEIIAVYQDVTQAEIAKKELQAERDKLVSIFEAMVDGIYIIDKDYNLEYINSALKKEFGDVKEKKCYEYFNGVNGPCSFCKNKEVFAGETVRWEWTSLRNNKTYDLIDTPMYNADGSISKLEIFRDITDRKKDEKEITQLSSAVTQSPSVIAITNLKGDLEYVNPKFTELTGYTFKETKGKNPRILKSGKQSREVYSNLWKTITSGKTWHGEFHNKKKNGELFWETALVSPIFNKKGKIINYLKVAEDITERKKADALLKASEVRFKSLFDGLGDAVFVTKLGSTNRGQILEVNSAATLQTGYSRDELLKMNIITDIQVPTTEDVSSENWEEILKKEETVTFTEKKKKKDGTEYWSEVIITQIYYKGEKASLSINHDITNRKYSEQIQKVIYDISDAVSTTENLEDLIKFIHDKLGSIIDTTNFYVALYDEETDMLSMPFYFDLKDNFSSAPAKKTLSKYVIQTMKPLLANIALKKKFVKEGILEYTGSLSKVWLGVPLIIDEKAIGVFAVQSYSDENAYNESDMHMLEFVSRQISVSIYRKKAEEELKIALSKATESDRLKTAFLQNISHEIRTPMNGIFGFSSLLKDPNLSGDEQQSYIDVINISGKRMLGTLNDLMDISMLETQQVKLNISPINVNNEMENIYNFFKLEVENKGLQLSFKTTLPDNEVDIKIDKDKFYAILSNLIKNAVKYTHEGSINFGYTKKNKCLEFYIKDTGIGIPKDRQKAIFNRFEQADIENIKVYEGAGLGLSISQGYIEILNGKIWVESKVGTGSQFYFTIPYEPIKKDVIKKPQKTIDTKLKDKKIKIIVVEDEDVAFDFLKIILSNTASSILHAKTGLEAVELSRDNPDTDLILMDIRMPIMSGYEATRKIREFNKDVVIIAQTAYALAGDREKAINAGCDDYITKPISKNKLMEMIEKLV